MTFLRGRLPLLALLACCGLLAGAASASAPVRAKGMLLSLGDVGAGYTVKYQGARTLNVVRSGDSATVQKELRRSWLNGAELAYRHADTDRGVISQADVFRKSARMDLILRAWQRDVVRISVGARQRVPHAAPGTGGALVRGHLLSYELLIYMWRHGRTIASVDVTGAKGTVSVSLLMKLARAQDARIASLVG
jgi:hypothetical protein